MNIISKIKKTFSTTSIKTKIYYLTAFTVIISCLVIGTFSYSISKNALLSNSRENFSSILKQIGAVLDDRVMIVQNLSFQMSQDPELQEMLTLSDEEISSQILAKQSSNFNKILILKGFDISFISDAYVIGTNSQLIRSYHHSTSKENLTAKELQQISKNLTHSIPYDWVTVGKDTYFVRKILDIKTNQNFGILCYKMSESFFKFQHSTAILDDDSIIILDKQQETIKKGKNVAKLQWQALFSKKNIEKFSTYSATTYHDSAAYLLTVENIKHAPWSVTGVIPEQKILTAIKPIKIFILFTILFCGGLLLFITSKITRSILANISVIEEGIKEYEIGNLHTISRR